MTKQKQVRNILTAKRLYAVLCLFFMSTMTLLAGSIHVTTQGDDNNPGTADAPLLTIHKAVELVQPGDTIWIHGGTYVISERIKIPEKATTPDKRCYMWAAGDGEVIIDGSGMHHTNQSDFKMGRCIYVNHLANYWHFKGLTLCNAEDNGMKVEGSYNIIEQCVFHDNNDTGLQIGMYKDFSIEETKSLPAGSPQFNPGYQFCRGNIVINCDSYNNYDSRTYNGSDDGGDADGFACKLFPGPGTEFHGCRAWTNSDDNWDLYMVYHPVLIDSCWAYHAGYTPSGQAIGNGNGFKLGGGGSSGGAAFDQSVGAHVVKNCVSFDNLHKGYDQNNAAEGMYVINCTGWGNEYNYRFPTIFDYPGMVIRNCIGWGATKLNHEFLSEDKEGSVLPDTEYNSWTTLDNCSPYKEGTKNSSGVKQMCGNYSGEFLSLSVSDFMAPREADGSLPKNNFARLKENSVFKDKGTPIVGFTPERHIPSNVAAQANLELIVADDLYIPYNDAAPDFGAFELDGVPADIVVPEKATLACISGNSVQEIISGNSIEDIVYEMGGAATGCTVTNLAPGLTYNVQGNLITISGTPEQSCTFTVTVTGGPKDITTTGIITIVMPFKVLTGDWYHFQDAQDNLPADLQNVIEVITGDASYPSRIDPEYKESDGSIPGGCTQGAFVMGRNSGGIQWNFSEGVLQLLVNLHITGGRTFKIDYTLADGTTGSASVAKMSKGTYCNWDVLENAGLTDKALNIRKISLLNNNSGGEVRLYDMYIRVPDNGTTGISGINAAAEKTGKVVKFFKDGQLVILKNGVLYNSVGQKLN